ncbi:hypothetical protein [Streptomyces litchfieldiae]|uniref:Secreted protein n=1 Tax=Streptomyces litchfieldiae TaxID=3075543 RepID=A0ABU2MT99_9ACTN|nr:hypothetical protein [Streptomyces sp. DSM 44938]MDT0344861.1 hypothetical protein [Streptomyces sp. DSM 44938]
MNGGRGARTAIVGGVLLILTLALTAGACGGDDDCESAPAGAVWDEGTSADGASADEVRDEIQTVAAPERSSGGSGGGGRGGGSRSRTSTTGGGHSDDDCDD